MKGLTSIVEGATRNLPIIVLAATIGCGDTEGKVPPLSGSGQTAGASNEGEQSLQVNRLWTVPSPSRNPIGFAGEDQIGGPYDAIVYNLQTGNVNVYHLRTDQKPTNTRIEIPTPNKAQFTGRAQVLGYNKGTWARQSWLAVNREYDTGTAAGGSITTDRHSEITVSHYSHLGVTPYLRISGDQLQLLGNLAGRDSSWLLLNAHFEYETVAYAVSVPTKPPVRTAPLDINLVDPRDGLEYQVQSNSEVSAAFQRYTAGRVSDYNAMLGLWREQAPALHPRNPNMMWRYSGNHFIGARFRHTGEDHVDHQIVEVIATP